MRRALAVVLLFVCSGCYSDVVPLDDGQDPLACGPGCPEGFACEGGSCVSVCAQRSCLELPGQCGAVDDGCGGLEICECEPGFECHSSTCCSLSCAGLACGAPNECGKECLDACPHWNSIVGPQERRIEGAIGAVATGRDELIALAGDGFELFGLRFDGSAWSDVAPPSGAGGVRLWLAAAEPGGSVLFLLETYGGAECWRWEEGAWLPLARAPPFWSSFSSMASDLGRAQVLLSSCGGSSCSTAVWDGVSWFEGPLDSGVGSARIVDGPDGSPLRFGLAADGTPTVWEWDGLEWLIRASLEQLPPGLSRLVLHRQSGTVVTLELVEEEPPERPRLRTWFWAGGEWRGYDLELPLSGWGYRPSLLPAPGGGVLLLDVLSARLLEMTEPLPP